MVHTKPLNTTSGRSDSTALRAITVSEFTLIVFQFNYELMRQSSEKFRSFGSRETWTLIESLGNGLLNGFSRYLFRFARRQLIIALSSSIYVCENDKYLHCQDAMNWRRTMERKMNRLEASSKCWLQRKLNKSCLICKVSWMNNIHVYIYGNCRRLFIEMESNKKHLTSEDFFRCRLEEWTVGHQLIIDFKWRFGLSNPQKIIKLNQENQTVCLINLI